MRFFVLLIMSLWVKAVFTQLSTAVQNPTALIQNVFLGDPNITISNVSYQGAINAIGSFDASGTNLGIPSGIIMTTGTILSNTNGPLGPNNKEGAGIDNNASGYSLLGSLVGHTTYNASVLSFDFVTCSDSIEFRYVFGSEEYPEYVGSKFNDVFGFFISGPGFAGQQNIARLPNGSPVTINNVNHGNPSPAPGESITGPSNAQYFVSNGDGTQWPYNVDGSPYIQYDGFTTVLTARAKIECGAKYRLTLAIADVGDPIFDSGIFLEAKSFKSVAPLALTYELSAQAFDEPNALVKACSEATIRLERTKCQQWKDQNVSISVAGNALPGVDYQPIPSTVTIPPGMLFSEFKLIPIYSGQYDGTDKIVIIVFNYIDNCNVAHSDSLEFILRDMAPLQIFMDDQWLTCPGDTLKLSPKVIGGGGQYHYLWNTGDTIPSISVAPHLTESYWFWVKDDCSGDTLSISFTVFVPEITPIILSGSPDIADICPYVPATFFVVASGGFGGYSYLWSDNWGATFGHDTIQEVKPSKTTTYRVIVTDVCGQSAYRDIIYTILSPPLIVELSPDQEICPGDSTLITSHVTGGYGAYYYSWPHSGETSPDVWVNPWFTTDFVVDVSDDCQTFVVTEQVRITVVKPDADFVPATSVLFNNLPITFHNLTINGSTYLWDFDDGDTSIAIHPNHVFVDPGVYWVTLIAWDDKGCVDSIRKQIVINEEYYIYIPNAFTPDGDRTNAFFKASTINIVGLTTDIYDRWGTIVFSSNDVHFLWNGTDKNKKNVPDGIYTYKMIYLTKDGLQGELIGHVTLLR